MYYKMDYNDRINFYLGYNLINENFNINDYTDAITIQDLTHGVNAHDIFYDDPLKELLIKTNNTNKQFYFRRADIMSNSEQHILTLSKNRCEDNEDSVLLRCLNFDRHWQHYYNKPFDIPFDKKLNKIFWRGVSTGCSDHHSSIRWCPRTVNRFILVEKWFNKNKNIDVGFSFLHRTWLEQKYNKYVKGSCSISRFLAYKYIISVEGNDKDSGLNWKLNSNSLVLMAKPRITSWLMETTLIPDHHYILLNDDFSNLEEKLYWCNDNQEECKEIIKNANMFMSQFNNNKIEELLEIVVINKYFRLIVQ